MRKQCCAVTQKVDEIDLLVDPVLLGGGPVAELLRLEPEANLVVGRLNGIGAMADVAPDLLQALSYLEPGESIVIFKAWNTFFKLSKS